MKHIFDFDPDTNEHWCYDPGNPDIIISGVVQGEEFILDDGNGTVVTKGDEEEQI